MVLPEMATAAPKASPADPSFFRVAWSAKLPSACSTYTSALPLEELAAGAPATTTPDETATDVPSALPAVPEKLAAS
jgi:hypothetical protein